MFTPKKSLLNPKFEGYKLESMDQSTHVLRYPLKNRPTQATASGKVPLSFEEMRSRITHNHLCIEPERGRAAYVDQEGNLCLADIHLDDRGDPVPSVRVIYQFPAALTSTAATRSNVGVQNEYPSTAFISPTSIMAADGCGTLYVLSIPEPSSSDGDTDMEGSDDGYSDPVGVFTLKNDDGGERPFQIHHLHRLSPITILLLITARHIPHVAPKNRTNTFVEFDLICVKIDLLSLRSSTSISQPRPFDILWQKRGPGLPFYTTFIKDSDAWFVLAGSTYNDPNAPAKEPMYEPTPDEIAPTPRAGENLDAPTPSIPKPHPYSWTQTSDSITIAFPLPSSVLKTDLKVLFTAQTLTVHVNSDGEGGIPIPHYSAKLLWDQVNPSVCFWTWDKEGEKRCGLLTLHMEKRHEGTRWMQAFASSKPPDSTTSTRLDNHHSEDDEEVPETLDPSELWHIRESLEKYTAALKTGEDASGSGLGRGVPSLASGEIDDEVDAKVGRAGCITWIQSTSGQTLDIDEEQTDMTILSTPLPGTEHTTSLLLKRDLDGLVYTLSETTRDPFVVRWDHTLTYPALAFVLASKQDSRFIHHTARSTSQSKAPVLAFESGTPASSSYSSTMRGGNLYVYHPPTRVDDKWSKQAVLKVDEGPAGALMGVGGITLGAGVRVVVCLTEGSLVLIKGL